MKKEYILLGVLVAVLLAAGIWIFQIVSEYQSDYIPTQMETQNSIMKKRTGEVRLPSDNNGNK